MTKKRAYESLQKQVNDLRLTLNEIRASQVNFNAEVNSHIDLSHLWEKKTTKHDKLIKQILDKIKEQDTRLDTLMQVLGGKFLNKKCDCGKMMTLISIPDRGDADSCQDSTSSTVENGLLDEDVLPKRKGKKKKINNEEMQSCSEIDEIKGEHSEEKFQGINDAISNTVNEVVNFHDENNIPNMDDDIVRLLDIDIPNTKENLDNEDTLSTCSKTSSSVLFKSVRKDYSIYSLREDFTFDFQAPPSHKPHLLKNWSLISSGNSSTFIKSVLFYLQVRKVDYAVSVIILGYNKNYFEILFGVPETGFNLECKFPLRVSLSARITRQGGNVVETGAYKYVVNQHGHFGSQKQKFLVKISPNDKNKMPKICFEIKII